ncbi:hypothetical protein RSSM_01626 [Rhodopirellula sallentina SM41]|uniref:Uncharacterized protein n=1 Tax=Rhodopirellula sallentina SM41 TaxID=1263870 RepID=M5U665_9BACT|nr:hypothetical protein RSSM_01626 [Rhodopirellula sallentina SM41]
MDGYGCRQSLPTGLRAFVGKSCSKREVLPVTATQLVRLSLLLNFSRNFFWVQNSNDSRGLSGFAGQNGIVGSAECIAKVRSGRYTSWQ